MKCGNDIAELYKRINVDNIVQNLKELIEEKSINPFGRKMMDGLGEAAIAEYYAARMREMGLEVRSDEIAEGRTNVFGYLKGNGEAGSLMLAGHLDTVDVEKYEDAFNVVVKEGKVFGRGSCDMKGALAVYLEVARVISESELKLKGDLILGGIADEEHQMLGSRYVGDHGPIASQCIIGEPTELKVCPVNKGQVCLIVKTYGKTVHSSVPEDGVNAIEKMMKAVKAFCEYHAKLRSRTPHPLCGTASLSIGLIKGGTLATAVPDYCEVEIDRRILPGETKEIVYAELHEVLGNIATEDPDFTYEISAPTFDIASNEISAEEPAVKALLDAYGEITGQENAVYGLPFGTDAPNMGCPTVVCGPGSIVQAHGICEYVEVEQLEKAAKMYLTTAMKLLL